MDEKGIERAIRRTASYYLQDGIVELLAGGLLVLAAAVEAVEIYVRPPVRSFGAWGMIVVAGISLPIVLWVVPKLKERVTYPRTGYVEYAEPSAARRWLAVGAGLVAALLVVAVVARGAERWREWLQAFSGLAIGLFLALTALRHAVARLYVLACFSVVAGVAVSLARLGEERSMVFYFVAMGTGLLTSGALALRRHLRQAPPSQEG
jgi:hypothetical protein